MGQKRGQTDASTRRCGGMTIDERGRAPWDAFVWPRVFAQHSGGEGETL